MRAILLDTTLRDGEQAPGVAFTREEKLRLASEIDRLGVDIIEAGIPAMGGEEVECLRAMNGLGLRAGLLCWCRMRREDIDAAAETGIANVHIAVPASPVHMRAKLGMEQEEVLERMADCVEYARKRGLAVSVGAEDASRAEPDFVIGLFREAEKLGAVRVRYADTMGILDPFSACETVRRVRGAVGVGIDFHGHNDFGMATANALGAFRGGADTISCSVNGLGERAGNTPLEEIALALGYMEGCETGVDRKRIQGVSALVERYSGKPLQPGKPIVGRDVFSHESGIHVDGLMKCRRTYEALDPGELGRAGEIVLGKFSGRAAVICKLREMGVEIGRQRAGELVRRVRSRSYDRKMDAGDFIRFIVEHGGPPQGSAPPAAQDG